VLIEHPLSGDASFTMSDDGPLAYADRVGGGKAGGDGFGWNGGLERRGILGGEGIGIGEGTGEGIGIGEGTGEGIGTGEGGTAIVLLIQRCSPLMSSLLASFKVL